MTRTHIHRDGSEEKGRESGEERTEVQSEELTGRMDGQATVLINQSISGLISLSGEGGVVDDVTMANDTGNGEYRQLTQETLDSEHASSDGTLSRGWMIDIDVSVVTEAKE